MRGAPGERTCGLTPRQVETLWLVANGSAYKQIAAELDVSVNTVKTTMQQIFEALGAKTSAHAVYLFMRRVDQTRKEKQASQPPGGDNVA